MENVTIEDIIKEINGRRDGQLKASFTMGITYLTDKGEYVRDGAVISQFRPVINVTRLNKFIIIELEYMSIYDSSIEKAYNLLMSFETEMQNYEFGTDKYPLLSLTVVPVKYNSEYFITASNPIFWALSSRSAGEDPTKIRILFEANDVIIYKAEVNQEAFDLEISRQNAIDRLSQMERNEEETSNEYESEEGE